MISVLGSLLSMKLGILTSYLACTVLLPLLSSALHHLFIYFTKIMRFLVDIDLRFSTFVSISVLVSVKYENKC